MAALSHSDSQGRPGDSVLLNPLSSKCVLFAPGALRDATTIVFIVARQPPFAQWASQILPRGKDIAGISLPGESDSI